MLRYEQWAEARGGGSFFEADRTNDRALFGTYYSLLSRCCNTYLWKSDELLLTTKLFGSNPKFNAFHRSTICSMRDQFSILNTNYSTGLVRA
jgi:hypothetical protein